MLFTEEQIKFLESLKRDKPAGEPKSKFFKRRGHTLTIDIGDNKFYLIESFDLINFDIILFENDKSYFVKSFVANSDYDYNLEFIKL